MKSYLISDNKLSITTKRKLRDKRIDFDQKISTRDIGGKDNDIGEILGKYKEHNKVVSTHIVKELENQEDIFKRKMKKRRDRSIRRSLNKSIEKLSNRNLKKNSKSNQKISIILKQLDSKKDDKIDNPFET